MRDRDKNRLGLCSRILFAICLIIIVITIPITASRGVIPFVSTAVDVVIAFLAALGALVLWYGRGNFRTWYRELLKWTVVISLLLAATLTVVYVLTNSPIDLAGFELRSVDRLITSFSGQAELVLLPILWAFLFGLALFFAAALTGGIWLVVQMLRGGVPDLLEEIRKLSFDKSDPWPRRIAAWLLIVPKIIDPSTLRLDVEPPETRLSRRRLVRSVALQVAVGTILGMYVSLNPTLLSIMPFTQTYALVSIPVGFIPLLTLPLLTLEALGAKVPGPRSDFYLYRGGTTRVVQLMLALGGLFWILWYAISSVGIERIVLTFSTYVVLLLLFSLLTSFIYVRFFEAGIVNDISIQVKSDGIE